MPKWKHRLRGIKETDKTAVCDHCGPTKIQFKKKGKVKGLWVCWYARQEHKAKTRGTKQGICPICDKDRVLVWDHNHATGKFRDWICKLCNGGLGLFGDNPKTLERAINYLTEKGHYAE